MQLQQPHNSTSTSQAWWPVVCFILIGAAVYSNIFSAPFVFDSISRIRDNVAIRQLWPMWDWLTYGQRPVAYFTLALNYAFHGYQVWSYHAVNLTIHIAAACLLFQFLRLTFQLKSMPASYQQYATWLAFAIALLWLVHPLQTQAVTYTIQRIESLMGLLYIAVFYGLIRSQYSPRPAGWLAFSCCCCWLGVATKEVMVTAPLLALWFDRVFLALSWRDIRQARGWYYAGLYASWLPLAFLVTQMGNYGHGGASGEVTSLQYALSQPSVILHYFYLSVWPLVQCLDYDWPVAKSMAAILPPALVLLGLMAAGVWCVFRKPRLGFAAAWIALILAPTSSIMPLADLAFEHRMYLPLAGVCALVIVAAFDLLTRLAQRYPAKRGALWPGAALAVLALGITLGGLSHWRNQDYQSAISIWRDVVEKAPHNLRGHQSLGVHLLQAGQLDEAVAEFRHVIQHKSGYPAAYAHLGMALLQQGALPEAMQSLKIALKLDPKFAIAQAYLGIAYTQQNQLPEAIEAFQSAIQLDPHLASAQSNLGLALARSGDLEQAQRHFQQAVRLEPGNADFHYNLGSLLLNRGELDQAAHYYEGALQRRPSHANAHYKLGRVRAMQQRGKEAIWHWLETLRHNPNHAQARSHLAAWRVQQARAASGQKQWREAQDHYARAIELMPNDAPLHNEFGEMLLSAGQTEQALGHFREALRLQPDFAPAQRNLKVAASVTD